jgi:steroid delta-isomerase-like uncharacterized protein
MPDVIPIDAPLRERREALLAAQVAAQNRSDIEGVIGTFAHPRFELVGSGRIYDGAAEVARYLRESREAFPDQHYDLITMHHADDAVICEFWMSGTHKGSVQGFEATGRHFRARMASFFLFDGDRLVGQRVYYDTRSIVRQLV